MALDLTPKRLAAVQAAMAPFLQFVSDSPWRYHSDEPSSNDFVFGNPNEMPLPDFVTALQRSVVPQNQQWFAYKWSEPTAQAVIARTLRRRIEVPFQADDILLTNGAYAAISVTLCALLDPGDEVIFVSPPWFFYEALITAYGGTPVRVPIDPTTFDLDLAAIEAAITPRTRAIIINSPNNPTGKIYPPATLTALATLLTEASTRIGHAIFILSDEAYSRIVFDNIRYPSPSAFYADTILIYTYGKTLLTPGQRIGYIALPPTMQHREEIRSNLWTAQIVTGFAFPNALLQHALGAIEGLSVDIEHLQRKRDRLVTALRADGYEVHPPDGTFYLMPRAPIADDNAFCNILAEHHIYCLPGHVVEMPGYFRLSLTANDAMIERALPGFAAARTQALRGPST